MVFLCKRCGRLLTSAKSIKLGYGPTCYRISKYHDNPVNVNVHEEIKFLKIEIKTLKKAIRELKVNNFTPNQTFPIIKIRKEERSPERDVNMGHMTEVIQELKCCFQKCDGNVKSLLKPIQIETNHIEISQIAIA